MSLNNIIYVWGKLHNTFFRKNYLPLFSSHAQTQLCAAFIRTSSYPSSSLYLTKPRMLDYRTHWRNRFMCVSFHRSFQITTVIAKQHNRMQHVTTTAYTHSLTITSAGFRRWKGSVRDAELMQRCEGMSIVCQGGLFISGTPLWWVICTKHPLPLFYCARLPFVLPSVSSSTSEMSTVSSVWVIGPQ